MKILCLGSCRVCPTFYHYQSGHDFHPNLKDQNYTDEINYYCRPYGQTISTRDTLEIIKIAKYQSDYQSDRYIAADERRKREGNTRIEDSKYFPDFTQFDGYIIEITSKKYVDKSYYSGTEPKEHCILLTMEDIFQDLTDISHELGNKPILLLSHLPLNFHDRMELNYFLSTWANKHNHVTFLDLTVVALDNGLSLDDIYIASEIKDKSLSYRQRICHFNTHPTHYTPLFNGLKTKIFNNWVKVNC